MSGRRPRLLITMGDVAGVGPEIIARAWPTLCEICLPVVVGDPGWLERAIQLAGGTLHPRLVRRLDEAEPQPDVVLCLPGSGEKLEGVVPGQVSGAAGKAAFDFLSVAIEQTRSGAAAGIVTAPLHKEGLRAAGLAYPGHTEILAERTGTRNYAMMLYGEGLGVLHVTLHMALRDIFKHVSTLAVADKITLLDGMLARLLGRKPRIGVAGLNPHAGDGGLFGDEEERIIRPAILSARQKRIEASGPWPADTLFVRARKGEFDGIVAMYHDQGHIAMKLLYGFRAVNITVGLPIIRTSVAHGTAYDIAGKGLADPASLIEAARVAAKLGEERSKTKG
jgi:4-hydroxythreonine-4-phosphate dehydrogenase